MTALFQYVPLYLHHELNLIFKRFAILDPNENLPPKKSDNAVKPKPSTPTGKFDKNVITL